MPSALTCGCVLQTDVYDRCSMCSNGSHTDQPGSSNCTPAYTVVTATSMQDYDSGNEPPSDDGLEDSKLLQRLLIVLPIVFVVVLYIIGFTSLRNRRGQRSGEDETTQAHNEISCEWPCFSPILLLGRLYARFSS